ncbi:hypothetical protein ACIBQ1_56450 [Nonomuraea sp. NPDC050153]|uniref:hypothetical protein n=1 Tax=Nonomuraea sp. NPDC050153 TaxID=3364359 RepID=UPI0037A38437
MTTSAAAAPARSPADIAADACWRLATHLDLLAHQLGEAALEPNEREHLADALAAVRQSVDVVTMAAVERQGT